MATINAGNITKGMFIKFKDVPQQVTKTEYMSPGKGTPVMRVKMKNATTGAASEFTYKSMEQVEVLEVEKKEMQYLYRDGNDLVFMHPKTFEQASVPMSLVEDQVGLFVPDLMCWVLWYQERAIGVTLPPHVVMTVIETEDSVAGNRVNAPKKLAKMETGIEIQVPLFIKVGDKISIDTSNSQYLVRAN
jgi:elongation factor P